MATSQKDASSVAGNTVIGPSILISGKLTGDEDLTVRGRVEGELTLSRTLIVETSGVVKANVDSRRDRKPPHSHFVGAPMPYFIEFSPGYGLHQGYLPGVPASHGCIRMPYWKARQFYNAAHVGTVVLIKP